MSEATFAQLPFCIWTPKMDASAAAVPAGGDSPKGAKIESMLEGASSQVKLSYVSGANEVAGTHHAQLAQSYHELLGKMELQRTGHSLDAASAPPAMHDPAEDIRPPFLLEKKVMPKGHEPNLIDHRHLKQPSRDTF
ncbi:Aste57867_24014 [Aphanomyces stellatus]|uniref:Aste57867_24014 protein n=1 Tax=Aphanomyces stellatus TaxID=120398 RepID=A0A485LTM8_9STRA|nr:hypothetical protein As57867_023941 [Aphanomyces stellatus]VFU00657.1 Aste57867_24014 [Aphanomyces stellatus]